jgi:hypothetical protein
MHLKTPWSRERAGSLGEQRALSRNSQAAQARLLQGINSSG